MLLAAAIFGIVAAVFTFSFFGRLQETMRLRGTEPVVVAIRDIPAGTVLAPAYMEIRNIPKEAIHPKAIQDMNLAMGQVARTTIMEGEQILDSRMGKPGTGVGLAYDLPAALRAVTIGADERIAVGFLVIPGNRVDVLLTYEDPDTKQRSTKILLEDILVLAVGQTLTPSKADPTRNDTKTVTLGVTPEQAEKLVFGEDYGRLRLALRPSTGG
jgi:pilus assembly protein CpaB